MLLLEHEVAVVAAHVGQVGPRDVVPRDAALSVALTDPVRLDTWVEGGLQHAVARDLSHIARRQAPHLVRVRIRVRVRVRVRVRMRVRVRVRMRIRVRVRVRVRVRAISAISDEDRRQTCLATRYSSMRGEGSGQGQGQGQGQGEHTCLATQYSSIRGSLVRCRMSGSAVAIVTLRPTWFGLGVRGSG